MKKGAFFVFTATSESLSLPRESRLKLVIVEICVLQRKHERSDNSTNTITGRAKTGHKNGTMKGITSTIVVLFLVISFMCCLNDRSIPFLSMPKIRPWINKSCVLTRKFKNFLVVFVSRCKTKNFLKNFRVNTQLLIHERIFTTFMFSLKYIIFFKNRQFHTQFSQKLQLVVSGIIRVWSCFNTHFFWNFLKNLCITTKTWT